MRSRPRKALVPWRAAWMPWRYERHHIVFLRRVQFPVYGLATPPAGFIERIAGTGEAGSAPVGGQVELEPVSVGLAYERGRERMSIRSSQPSDIMMRGLAEPADPQLDSWEFSVTGSPVTFNGWRDQETWQCEAAVGAATIQITANFEVDDLDLVVRSDLLDACSV